MLDLSPQQILRILAGRYRLIVLVSIISVVATYVTCLVWPARYAATTTVVVDTKAPDPVASALTATSSTGTTMTYIMNIMTETDIIASDRVARRVVQMLRLDEDKEINELWRESTGGRGELPAWLGELMLKKLTVKNVTPSNVISITFVGADPDFAALVANAFARAYIETNIALKVEPAKDYAEWFGQQESTMRNNLEKAQARLSGFLQEKGIVANVETADKETATLLELEKQHTAAQVATSEFASKQKSSSIEMLPEVQSNTVLTSLKADLRKAEVKLQEAAGNLGENHPQYMRTRSEIEALRERLRIETRNVVNSFPAARGVGELQVEQLRRAVETQKRKVLQIKSDRDQLARLEGDVEAKKKALDAITGRNLQAELVSQTPRAQVVVLTPAVAPIEPSQPKILLYTLISIPLGLMLGIVAALALEQVDQRVRNADDLAGVLQVIGTVVRPRVPAERFYGRFFPWRRSPGVAMK